MINPINNKELSLSKQLLLVLLLSFIFLFVFFKDVLLHLNTSFFNISGDGLQVYYNTLYHVFYDANIFTENSMHYPYNESVFFMGSMPLLGFLIKYLGLKYYTIGIMNGFMLFSIPACALFIYLIFVEYKVSSGYGIIMSVLIAFLSPQIIRYTGHYNLSYSFAIPGTIWLMIRFLKQRTFKLSFFIFFYCFFLATMHMYLYIFSFVIILFAWSTLLSVKDFKSTLILFGKHFLIQAILPVVLIQALIFYSTGNDARTASPWGFFEFYSNWNGVFFPFNRFYAPLFYKLGYVESVSYEGIAFVGLSAFLFSWFLALKFVFNLLSFKKPWNLLNDKFLNALLLCSILSLLFSFCIPFKFEHQDWVQYFGILKQFRALGRFTWIFFYVINILLVIFVLKLPETYNKYKIKHSLLILVIIITSYDSYCNIEGLGSQLNNKFEIIQDVENKSEINYWVTKINSKKFQAILPLPYFHLGSENLGYAPNEKSLANACIVSIKTGLPMVSVYNSRISLEKSFANVQLLKVPTGRYPKIIDEFKNEKDLLLVVDYSSCNVLEKEIIKYADSIFQAETFKLYRLPISKLKQYYFDYSRKIIDTFNDSGCYKVGDFSVSDTTNHFVYFNYSFDNGNIGFIEKGVKREKIDGYVTIANTGLKYNNVNDTLSISFWIKNLDKDLLARTDVEIKARNENNEYYSLVYSKLLHHDKQINGKWTLVEFDFKLKNTSDIVEVVLWNFEINYEDFFIVDDLLFRPKGMDVYLRTDSCLYKNNRINYLNN